MADYTYKQLAQGLDTALSAQAVVVRRWERYYTGHNRQAYTSAKWRQTFGRQLAELTSNWSRLIVDAAAERLAVTGFKFPGQGAGGSDVGADKTAWDIWQANSLDARQHFAHTTAIYAGRAYLIVAPPEAPGSMPRITVEHPSQVFVQTDALGRRLSAIKKWQEANADGSPGDWLITIYTPDVTYRMRRRGSDGTYMPRSGDVLVDEIPNSLGVVPVVPIENRPMLLEGGQSDIAPIAPLQDAIDKEMANALINSDFASFPQRWATGIDVPTDPENGEPLDREEWMAAADRLWVAPRDEAKFGQFAAHDGSGTINQISMLVQHMAAQTNTPPHYLLGGMVNISGDALRAAEAGLYSRVRAKQLTFGEGWEEAIRIACGWLGDLDRMRDQRAETVWRNPEVRSEGELVDGAMKLWQARMLPLEMVLERIGYGPEDIERAVRLLGMPDRPGPPEPAAPTDPDLPLAA